MTAVEQFRFSQGNLVPMQPNSAVDGKLTDKTRYFLREFGLRNSEELGFNFTGKTFLFPNQVVVFEDVIKGRNICLDIRQGEIIRWEDEEILGFINSSAEQFVRCVEEFENYLYTIQAKEVFGPFYSNNDVRSERTPYVNYLTSKLRKIDPIIFDKGYYWPAFIEDIELGI